LGGLYGGFALSIIAYFILIKGAKGTSFLTPETVLWIKNHTLTILAGNFVFFSIIFQILTAFTRINVLTPIVLIGTFALAMAFAANDLVNFIGVPLAGLSSYNVAAAMPDPLNITMGALHKKIQSDTMLLLIAGGIMIVTLWISKKARTVTRTEVSLGRQDEGVERFGASTLSRIIVRMACAQFEIVRKAIPVFLRRIISRRLDTTKAQPYKAYDGSIPSFDLLRASVNLIVASAVVSFATSLKLPLSTTYVTFMVAMGTSLSDQAWGRESAVYRVTGVLAVIGGWFFTAFVAFSVSMIFAVIISYFKLLGIIVLMLIAFLVVFKSYRLHFRREEGARVFESLDIRHVSDSEEAIKISLAQTGYFLREISGILDQCFDAVFSANRNRLSDAKVEADKIQRWADTINANIFKTLRLLNNESTDDTQTYFRIIRSLQDIAESHRDIVMRAYNHFENSHAGLAEDQKTELRKVKTLTTRLLWNTAIMLLKRKKVDYDYVANQKRKLSQLVDQYDAHQIKRIQDDQAPTSLSILYYGLLENCTKISDQTQELLNIFRVSFVK
ncbi:MAG: inorganic phosphate transporter, partial [Thermodesulfobacteriota bacterium]|nr:inorganic phosphate transporter [Thermodesulfobacteriota bacterium]